MDIEEIEIAIARIEKRIEELDEFDPSSVGDRDDPRIRVLETSVRKTLQDILGESTPDYLTYRNAESLDRASISMYGPTPIHEVIDGLERGKANAIAVLKGLISMLREQAGSQIAGVKGEPVHNHEDTATNEKVFIVHGHDDAAKEQVARFIALAGLEPVILHEQSNQGRTVIEKLEANSDQVSFAIAILTPDDIGGKDMENLLPRARQNVIGELFYFMGKFGRNRVCALLKKEIEAPSDIDGIVYTPMDNAGAWKQELLKELDAAGYQLNWKDSLK